MQRWKRRQASSSVRCRPAARLRRLCGTAYACLRQRLDCTYVAVVAKEVPANNEVEIQKGEQ